MRAIMAGLLAVLAVGLTAPAVAAPEQELTEAEALAALEAELPGTLMNNPIAVGWQTFGDGASTKVIRVPEIPGGWAYEVKVKQGHRNPWDISVVAPLTSGIAKGDAVLVAFWSRSEKPASEIGTGTAQVRVQQISEPYAGVAESAVTLGDGWQLHYVKGIAAEDLATGKINVAFNVGRYKQTVQFGQVYVMNLGQGVRLEDLPSAPEDL
jgi:hypothetical protein